MTFRVSKLKESKVPELVEVAKVDADRFEYAYHAYVNECSRSYEGYGIKFFLYDEKTFRTIERLIAFFPGIDWIVEAV